MPYPRDAHWELAALRWDEVNLEQRYVSIHHSLDLRNARVKAAKTGFTPRVPLPVSLLPRLQVLHSKAKGVGLVVQHTHANKDLAHGLPRTTALSATLRDHLRRAGVTRPEFFEDFKTSKDLTFYDLRTTGITREAFAGTPALSIQQRAD